VFYFLRWLLDPGLRRDDDIGRMMKQLKFDIFGAIHHIPQRNDEAFILLKKLNPVIPAQAGIQ